MVGARASAQEATTKTPSAKESKKPAGVSAEKRAKNIESFEVVWKTIRDKHYDPKLSGLDWQAVHDQIRPKVERAKSMAEARAAMSEAIDRLGQTHFGIIPGDAYEDVESPESGPGEVGLDARIINGRAVVTAVPSDQAAHAEGVKTGWVIEKIGGKPVSQILKATETAYAKSGMVAARKVLAVLSRLHGPIGSKISVDFLDEKDKPIHLDIKAQQPKGVPATFGNLPTYYVRFVAKRIDGTIAYVSLNIFFDLVNVLKSFGETIEANRDADGLIIDLRGNPGGIGAMSFAIGGWLVSERGLKLGTLITREGSLNFTLLPRRHPFDGTVAVIVDELSMSTSEILAGGLKDLGRAKVFGTKTPGAALPSVVVVLPNGDLFQYAFANYISKGGRPLEGVGVVPDISVPVSRGALLAGHDPALDAAALWIHSAKKAH
jgi:carboxyl-terminal processing protease